MRIRSSFATLILSATFMFATTTTATALDRFDATTSDQAAIEAGPPTRKDSTQRPVFFVKGYTPGDACGSKWNSAATLFNRSGWEGPLHRVGFYEEDDPECDVRIDPEGKGTVDTSLKDLGRGLAWKIHDMYSVKGQTVDLVGHSMGGLIIRAALAGYAKGDPTWPDTLYVEDVVTLGTPHKVAWMGAGCLANLQCREMYYPRGAFRSWLGPKLHQAQGGTDWTLVGSNADFSVSAGNGAPTDVGAQHLVRYSERADLDHSQLRTVRRAGAFPLRYTNNGGAWGSQRDGAAPLRVTMNALYWHSRW
ncbi:esterase/lipase family protein [Embleya sp. NPDC050154]|uniref:esterase/lipase family protein n=1 Tax=unclassified Embleya TaxID=2699296 RepID=UPI003799C9B2